MKNVAVVDVAISIHCCHFSYIRKVDITSEFFKILLKLKQNQQQNNIIIYINDIIAYIVADLQDIDIYNFV